MRSRALIKKIDGDTMTHNPMNGFKTVMMAALFSLGLIASQVHAQAYPNKPIKAIVPFAAGSATDQIGRAFAQKMADILGQPIVVENKAGVNGMLGADAVAKAAPDGYTLLIGTNSTNAALKSLMKKLPYDQDTAFPPVAYFGSVPLIVAVNNEVPVKNLKEFVDMAKAKPTQVTFASASTSQLVSSEMLASMAGIQMTQVPYKSGPAAMTDLIGGQVGFAGHITVGNNVGIKAKSGITKNVKDGQIMQGSLAFGYTDFSKSYVHFKNLPKIVAELEELKKEILNLKTKNNG